MEQFFQHDFGFSVIYNIHVLVWYPGISANRPLQNSIFCYFLPEIFMYTLCLLYSSRFQVLSCTLRVAT